MAPEEIIKSSEKPLGDITFKNISLPLKLPIHVGLVHLRYQLAQFEIVKPNDYNILYKLKPEFFDQAKKVYIEKIHIAGKLGVKILCFGELTYPFSSNEDEEAIFQQILSNLAKQYEMWIICGSYHHYNAPERKRFNISPMASPHENILISQRKLNSAILVDEIVDEPSFKEVQICETGFGDFINLICRDLADARIWQQIGYYNGKKWFHGIHFVFCPAYDPGFKVSREVYRINKTHKVCIGFVNAHEGLGGRQEYPILLNSQSETLNSDIHEEIYIFKIGQDDICPPNIIDPIQM